MTGQSAGSEGDGPSFSKDEIDALIAGADLADSAVNGSGANSAEATANSAAESPAVRGTGATSSGGAGTAAGQPSHSSTETQFGTTGTTSSPSQDGTLPTTPFEFAEFAGALGPTGDPHKMTMLGDVRLRVKVQLGRTRMLVEDILKLGEGSVVELDKLAGDPVDVLVNDRLIARGEVLVLNDNFCVRISEVISNDPHRITV